MPYRLKPSDKKVVQVKRKERYVDLKPHKTVAEAKAHLYMLNKNVHK